MTTIPQPEAFLSACEIIDCDSPQVIEAAQSFSGGDPIATARRCFEFVRDQVFHSSDHEMNPVTCIASDVLRHRTGFCYAKSHLLAALLRANGIPAGLCYQRLRVDDSSAAFCLHGLNAVFLPEVGWYRIDPRGERMDIHADFDPPREALAFPVLVDGEQDIPGMYVRPLRVVVDCLQRCGTWQKVTASLPDYCA